MPAITTAVIWFNKYLSNTWEILAYFHEARSSGELRLVCTHPRSRYPGRLHCDLFEQEPDGLQPNDYVTYCLEFARRQGVDLFFPGRNVLALVQAQQRFAEQGTRVLATADAATLTILSNKASVYAALAGENIDLPEYAVVHDLASFDAAWARMRKRRGTLCYKPAVGVYGQGFHIIADPGGAHDGLRTGNSLFIDLEETRRRLARESRSRDLLLMQYLPGPERSVDCLARDGELLRAVVRRKEDAGQVIEDNPKLVAVVRRLTAHFGLTNLFNVQFRDAGGRSYLLEINTRMSGGLPFSCRSGLVLPYWAVRLALGSVAPEALPQPRTGFWIPQPEPMSSL